ncbi:MAG: hypothetical protein PVJ80_06170 [Gemmatimonadota bacterium]
MSEPELLRTGRSPGPELPVGAEIHEEVPEVIIPSEPVRAWCQSCRSHVTLINVRPWPNGILVIGECPSCQSSLASRKPVGWKAPESVHEDSTT